MGHPTTSFCPVGEVGGNSFSVLIEHIYKGKGIHRKNSKVGIGKEKEEERDDYKEEIH